MTSVSASRRASLRHTADSGDLRHSEGLHLRVKDVDVESRQLIVRDGKGAKDRVTVLPESVIADVLAQKEMVRRLHDVDRADGFGSVWLPYAFNVFGINSVKSTGFWDS